MKNFFCSDEIPPLPANAELRTLHVPLPVPPLEQLKLETEKAKTDLKKAMANYDMVNNRFSRFGELRRAAKEEGRQAKVKLMDNRMLELLKKYNYVFDAKDHFSEIFRHKQSLLYDNYNVYMAFDDSIYEPELLLPFRKNPPGDMRKDEQLTYDIVNPSKPAPRWVQPPTPAPETPKPPSPAKAERVMPTNTNKSKSVNISHREPAADVEATETDFKKWNQKYQIGLQQIQGLHRELEKLRNQAVKQPGQQNDPQVYKSIRANMKIIKQSLTQVLEDFAVSKRKQADAGRLVREQRRDKST